MIHELKTWPEYFQAIKRGDKGFEIRKTDRVFSVGDVLNLNEFRPCETCGGSGRQWDNGDKTECCEKPHGTYTGDSLQRAVTFILKGPHFGLKEDRCVMSIRPINPKC